MNDHEAALETVDILLSPQEGRQLGRFLDPWIRQADGPFHLELLQAAQDKLDDANALAAWLRENVRLTLAPSEAAEVREVLRAKLDDPGSPPEQDDAVLRAIAEKFRLVCSVLAKS